MTINPLRLAKFLVLPGAADLIEAFASLPPGEVRDSAVSHVQVLAKASAGWAAPEADTLTLHEPPPPEVRQLSAPQPVPAASLEGQIVERALKGEPDASIAWALNVNLAAVIRIKRKAAREGGLDFPKSTLAADPPRPKVKGRRSRNGRLVPVPLPVPAPPYWWEDPQSPVWENGNLLPTLVATARDMSGVGPLDTATYKTMTTTAERRGMDLRGYIALRLNMIRRVEAGEKPGAVALDLRVQAFEVYSILSRVGRPRGRADVLATPAPVPVEAEPADPPSVIAVNSATRWGFDTVAAYQGARVEVRDLRLAGVPPAVIADRVGKPYPFVKNTLDAWKDHGTEFPPITFQGKPRMTADPNPTLADLEAALVLTTLAERWRAVLATLPMDCPATMYRNAVGFAATADEAARVAANKVRTALGGEPWSDPADPPPARPDAT